jgi:DNA-binding MarR family transcriptional regulator
MAANTAPDVRETWHELRAAHQRVSVALDRALQERHRLSLSEFEVIQRLAESEQGYLRMQELAGEIHLSQSALSRLVGRLDRAGYTERDICEDDRRGIYTRLTDRGREAVVTAEPTYRAILREHLAAG